MQRTRCYYFYDEASRCNKRTPGAGCDAIGGFNRIHAILGASESCIATHPSDMCVALAALDATVQVQGNGGARSIPMNDFHRLPGDTPQIETSLKPDELITAIHLPPLAFARNSRYRKVRDRASYAFALVSVAAALETEGGTIKTCVSRWAASLTSHGGLIRQRKRWPARKQPWRHSVARLKKSLPMPGGAATTTSKSNWRSEPSSACSVNWPKQEVCDERRADHHGDDREGSSRSGSGPADCPYRLRRPGTATRRRSCEGARRSAFHGRIQTRQFGLCSAGAQHHRKREESARSIPKQPSRRPGCSP